MQRALILFRDVVAASRFSRSFHSLAQVRDLGFVTAGFRTECEERFGHPSKSVLFSTSCATTCNGRWYLQSREYSSLKRMPINVILTGATGTAGSAALKQAIADPDVSRITVLTRRPLSVEHEKLRVIIHKDFNNYDEVAAQLADHQVALWCLGISTNSVSKEEYQVITYDYTLAGAKAFGAANPSSFKFLYLSGQGADPTEKSRILFARVKGKTENALAKLGHPSVVSFRPGYIYPDQPTKTTLKTNVASGFATLAQKTLPSMIIYASDLAKALLEVAKHGTDKPVLSNTEIRKLVSRYSADHAADSTS